MGLSSNLAPFVDSIVRRRGAEYFRARRVRLDVCTSTEAEAIVVGSSRYYVKLTRASRLLRCSCSCPYIERGEPCKHIWATLLAADVKGGLRAADGSPPLRLTVAEAMEDFDEGGGKSLVAAATGPSAPWARPVPAARAPSWRELIGQVAPLAPLTPAARAAPPSWAPAGELLYAIDVPATLRSHHLTLQVLVAPRKRDGTLGKLRLLKITRKEIPQLPDTEDRKILFLLAGATQGGLTAHWYSPYASTPVATHCEMPEAAAALVLPQLCATGRCRLLLAPDLLDGEPLAWDDGGPWELGLEVREERGGDCTLTGWLRRGDESMPLAQAALLLGEGFVFTAGWVARFEGSGAFSWVTLLRKHGDLHVPAADRDELIERLLAAPDLPRLDLPRSMQIEEAHPAPQPRLRLRTPSKKYLYRDWPRADLSFFYEGREVAAGAPGHGLYQRPERRFLLRDSAAEERSVARLRQLGFRPSQDAEPGEAGFLVANSRVPKAVRALLAEGWSVEAEGKLYRSAGQFKVGVSSGVDWFELRAQADFEGERVDLPRLLAALHRGESFIALGDGSLGLLPEEWLQRLAPVSGLGVAEGDHLRFQAAQAPLLDAWLMDEPETTFDEAFERARQRLRSFAGVAPVQEPKGFRGELRGYQRIGLGWLHYLRDFGFGGCLADDMGLGKTIQVLALLEARRTQRKREKLPPSLLVVPKSLVFNWLAEASRFTPRLSVLDYTGVARSREGDPFAGHDLVLTTYGTLRRDIARLRQTEFDYLILDEAQAIKNAESQTARAARLLRGRHRLALTGTPIENHLGELWSLLEFLNPGLLGSSPLFRTQSDELRDADPRTRELLASALRPFLLRRTKEAVAPELPAKVEQTLFCQLPPQQRRLYDELRDHYRGALDARIGKQGLGKSKILVLEALLRLRQAACHPGLIDPERAKEPCAKLDLLLPQLQEILEEGHKALVFSQFTSFLALLRRQLEAEGIPYLYLDGQTRNRQERVEAFQNDPSSKLFLISLKAGGLGLNLTAADYVYLLDPWWNPAVESQAIDRTHRIGQTRPVFACRLVARDTVEEKILELQKSKRELADAVIEADQSLVAGLTRADLELLLS
jgi:superfamily II DNA or RNA helicase